MNIANMYSMAASSYHAGTTYSLYTKYPLGFDQYMSTVEACSIRTRGFKNYFLLQTSGCVNTQIWRHITNFFNVWLSNV